MSVELHGYQYSVYAWITRFALHEKGVSYQWVEVNPFADDLPANYLAMHPFGRVPTLINGDFVLFETGAITRYVDEAFVDGLKLQPSTPEARARVSQIISIVDSYIYWPLVRQVFSHDVMGPLIGRPSDPSEVHRGLEAAPHLLEGLNSVASGNGFLVDDMLTLADIHLAPMISYFVESDDGHAIFRKYERLCAWWKVISARAAFAETKPKLPKPCS